MPWTDLAVWIGWIGCALSAAFALPQALKLMRVGDTRGVALLPWQALLAANLAWTVYATITQQPPLLISYSIAAALALFVIVKLSRQEARNTTVDLAAPVALGLAMLLALPVPALFGLLTIVPGTVGWISQFARIRRRGRPQGLSAASMLLYLLCMLVWLGYALIVGDVALGTSVVPLIVVITATLIAFTTATNRSPAESPM